MSEFPFLYPIKSGDLTLTELDCEYVSNGSQEDPTIRVTDCYDATAKVWKACDLNRGDDWWETLSSYAETEYRARCREADIEADRNRRLYEMENWGAAE